MKNVFVVALCMIGFAGPVMADLNLLNGSVIRFTDNTTMSTAAGVSAPADHGGTGNAVAGTDSFIGGGKGNSVTDNFSVVGGGYMNQAGDNFGTAADKQYATVGGGAANEASGYGSTVSGGGVNTASGYSSTVGGGRSNTADGSYSSVSGGSYNGANAQWTTVSGGYYNDATDDFGTVGGGRDNQAGDATGTTSDKSHATVGGGYRNTASGQLSTVSGGNSNQASGLGATVSGGFFNLANGNYSFAAGYNAAAVHNNSFVWGGASGVRTSDGPDTFNVWSSEIYLNASVYHSSDRNMKEAFSFVSAREVLDKVVDMPITTWRFKSEEDSVRHIGPVAQDFMAAFGYGKKDTHITATDADGVALAAIQGLRELHRHKDEEITALRWQNAQLHGHNAALETRLARLEKAILRE